MIRVLGILLFSLLPYPTCAPANPGTNGEGFSADKFIFRGRLVSAYFTRNPIDGVLTLKLQFLIEDPIADFHVSKPGSLESVATDIQLDPSTLAVENYRRAIEEAIGHGVQLGGSCLVVSEWPGARGKELQSLEPATPEAEARIRADNRQYILEFRRFNNSSQFKARQMRLRSLAHQIDHLIQKIDEIEPEHRQQIIEAVRRDVEGFQADFVTIKEMLVLRNDELQSSVEVIKDPEERSVLTLMRDDLKKIMADIERDRSSLIERLREAGFDTMPPK